MNFLLKLLKGASLAKCSRALELVRQRSGKGKRSTLLDMLLCTLRYGAGYHDYALFGFERLTAAQRDTYVTRIRNKRILDRMNKKDFFDEFNDKTRFLTHFSQYLGRDFLLLPADGKALSAFLQKHPSFFAKPSRGCGGRGILHLNRTDFPGEAALMQFLTEKGLGLSGSVFFTGACVGRGRFRRCSRNRAHRLGHRNHAARRGRCRGEPRPGRHVPNLSALEK